MLVVGLGYIGIGASDVEAWRQFAAVVLGCQVIDGPDGGLLLRIDERAWRIAIEKDDCDDILYAGWEVSGPEALDEIVVRIRGAGGEAKLDRGRLAKRRGVLGLAQFTDPAGVKGELFWGATETGSPFVSAAGTSGFVTGGQGLGHIVIGTQDPDAMGAFYRGVLGFKLSDMIFVSVGDSGFRVPITFLHCNERHHSLAFMGNPNPKKLHHFMLETRSLDDVGAALDRLDKSGGKLALTLGRHSNDKMISFYAYTPSGIEVEYGWGARVINDTDWSVVRHDRISDWGHKFVGHGIAPV